MAAANESRCIRKVEKSRSDELRRRRNHHVPVQWEPTDSLNNRLIIYAGGSWDGEFSVPGF